MKLTEKFPVRLTKEDYTLLHEISEKLCISPGQLARLGVRKILHEKLEDIPSLMGD